MPEGDTIHRVANVLRRALAGKVVTGFEVVAPRMSSDATRFALNAAESMWVDERTGLPCHVCGTAVAWGYHPSEFRKSWYCPRCQNVTWAPTTAEALARLG